MSDKNKDTVLIVDGMNAFYRGLVMDPSLTENGDPIGGTKGTMKIVQRFIKDMRPDDVWVVWDGLGGAKRKRNINENYKQGRKLHRDSLNRDVDLTEEEHKENKYWQFIRTIKYFNDTPVKQFMYEGAEADDVISYLVQETQDEQINIVITNDKDFYQILMYEDVAIYRPTQGEYVLENDVVEEYDIHPKNFTIARAIAGDTSDNLEGVYRVGLKTVAKRFSFLKEDKIYDLDDVFEVCKEKEGDLKLYGKILDDKEKVRNNYKIMQLYSPLMSHDTKKDVNKILEEDVTVNRISFIQRAGKDGIDNMSWDALFSYRKKR